MTQMKCCLVFPVWLASALSVAAEPSLMDRLGDAKRCSDAVLEALARSCDPPERMASMAVAECQSKWNIVAERAIGPTPPHASSTIALERSRSLKQYLKAMDYEYIRVAELKVIDLQRASANCGFE